MNPPSTFPVISLTVERMKHAVQLALSEETLNLDELVQRELERVCSEESIQAIVAKLVEEEVKRAYRETLENFFRYGEGREAIKAVVKAKLNDPNYRGPSDY